MLQLILLQGQSGHAIDQTVGRGNSRHVEFSGRVASVLDGRGRLNIRQLGRRMVV